MPLIPTSSNSSQNRWPCQKKGFLKCPPSLSMRAQQPTEHLGCIPETLNSCRVPSPIFLNVGTSGQQNNFNSSVMAKRDHFVGPVPSPGFLPWRNVDNCSPTLEPFFGHVTPEVPYNYFAHGYSSSASQPFQEAEDLASTRALELQLRGELRACEEEIKRLKKENPFFLVVEGTELLQAAAEQRAALAGLLCAPAGGPECVLQTAGRVLGVRLGCTSDTERHDLSFPVVEPAVLDAAVREGTAIRDRLLHHTQIKDEILEKYVATCEEMKLAENLCLLNALLTAVEAALQSLSSGSLDASPKLDLSYAQLLRAAFVWKVKFQECVQKVSQAIEDCCSVHVAYADTLRASLPRPITATSAGPEGAHEDGSNKAGSEDVKTPLADMAALKLEFSKKPWKMRATLLHSALQAEVDHAKKAHIVTDALAACHREAEDRIDRIEKVQQILALVRDRAAGGGGELKDGEAESSLSLLDYVRRSRLDVPSNVKAAVVFDVLKELRELHRTGQVYRWLNPVNIIAEDGFKLRSPSDALTAEPLPPWRFVAPELTSHADQTPAARPKATASSREGLPSPVTPQMRGNDGEGYCRTRNGSNSELRLNEVSKKMSPSRASAETSKPGSVSESSATEHEANNFACDVYSFGQVVLWLLSLNNSTHSLIETLTTSMAAVPVLNSVLDKNKLARPSIDELLKYKWFGEKVSPCDEVIAATSQHASELLQCDDQVSRSAEFPTDHSVAGEQADFVQHKNESSFNELFRSGLSVVPLDASTLRIRLEEEALMKEMEDSDFEDDECKLGASSKPIVTSVRADLESYAARHVDVPKSGSGSGGSISSEIEELMYGQHSTSRFHDQFLAPNDASVGHPFGPSPNIEVMSKSTNINHNERGNLVSHGLVAPTTKTQNYEDPDTFADERCEAVAVDNSKFHPSVNERLPEANCSNTPESEVQPAITQCDVRQDFSFSFEGSDDEYDLLSSVDSINESKITKAHRYFGVSPKAEETTKTESDGNINSRVDDGEQLIAKSSSASGEGQANTTSTSHGQFWSHEHFSHVSGHHHHGDSAGPPRSNYPFSPALRPKKLVKSKKEALGYTKGCIDDVLEHRYSNSEESDPLESGITEHEQSFGQSASIRTIVDRQSSFDCSDSTREYNGASCNENKKFPSSPPKRHRMSLAKLKGSNNTLQVLSDNKSDKNSRKLPLGASNARGMNSRHVTSDVTRFSDVQQNVNGNFKSTTGGNSKVTYTSSRASSLSTRPAKAAVDVTRLKNSNLIKASDNERQRDECIQSNITESFSSSFALPGTSNSVVTTSADADFRRGFRFGHFRGYHRQTVSAREHGDSRQGNAGAKFSGLSSNDTADKKMDNLLTPGFEVSEACSFDENQDGPDEILLILDDQS